LDTDTGVDAFAAELAAIMVFVVVAETSNLVDDGVLAAGVFCKFTHHK